VKGQLRARKFDVPMVHCITHQFALAAKVLNKFPILAISNKIVMALKGKNRALTHRKFLAFLKTLDYDHNDLVCHTEVRWLSRANSLDRLF